MGVMLLHVSAGVLALLSGTVALSALKGGRLHRKSGRIFVGAMLVMSASGALIAVLQPKVIVLNVVAGVLTFYLVLTALRTVRRPVVEFDTVDVVVTLVAVTAGFAAVVFGLQALGSSVRSERFQGPPALMFGTVALLTTVGDVRILLGRRIEGPARIARHLWRMCFGFFIAAGSFFLGPPQRLPAPLRGSPLRPIPVLLVLLIMFFWLARVRLGKRHVPA